MTNDSFNIGNINSFDAWGIKVIAYDVFSPPKRSVKRNIPFRNGSYDYGAKYYEERTLRLDCRLTKRISKAEFREIIYTLSQKNHISLWDEPDKHYVAELYDSVDVDVFPRGEQRDFTLPFICEPFAYKDQVVKVINFGATKIEYSGTAETPTLIILKNPTPYYANIIKVTAVKKKILN